MEIFITIVIIGLASFFIYKATKKSISGKCPTCSGCCSSCSSCSENTKNSCKNSKTV